MVVVASQLSGSRAQAQWLCGTVTPRPAGSSQTRDRTHVPCIGGHFFFFFYHQGSPRLSFILKGVSNCRDNHLERLFLLLRLLSVSLSSCCLFSSCLLKTFKVRVSSVAQWCLTLCNPMDCSGVSEGPSGTLGVCDGYHGLTGK